ASHSISNRFAMIAREDSESRWERTRSDRFLMFALHGDAKQRAGLAPELVLGCRQVAQLVQSELSEEPARKREPIRHVGARNAELRGELAVGRRRRRVRREVVADEDGEVDFLVPLIAGALERIDRERTERALALAFKVLVRCRRWNGRCRLELLIRLV